MLPRRPQPQASVRPLTAALSGASGGSPGGQGLGNCTRWLRAGCRWCAVGCLPPRGRTACCAAALPAPALVSCSFSCSSCSFSCSAYFSCSFSWSSCCSSLLLGLLTPCQLPSVTLPGHDATAGFRPQRWPWGTGRRRGRRSRRQYGRWPPGLLRKAGPGWPRVARQHRWPTDVRNAPWTLLPSKRHPPLTSRAARLLCTAVAAAAAATGCGLEGRGVPGVTTRLQIGRWPR